MSEEKKFVYTDESSIDEEFKCVICENPFEEPTCTPCDHTFCKHCIEKWLRKENGESGSCPICRYGLTVDADLKPASRIIVNYINRYPVTCLACQLNNIPRGSFTDHISRSCVQRKISCPATQLSCAWKGTVEQLNDHIQGCLYYQMLIPFESILNENKRLEKLINDQQAQISAVNERCAAQQRQIDELTSMMETFGDSTSVSIRRKLTFDDLTAYFEDIRQWCPAPEMYADFRWSNAGIMHREGTEPYSDTGFATALQGDQNCVVFNFGCTPLVMVARRGTFSIISFEATCGFQDELMVTVIGRRLDKSVVQREFTLYYRRLQTFSLQWKDIEELEFAPSGGKQLSHINDTDKHVILTCLSLG